MLPPEERISEAVGPLIDEGQLFVVHAPRQTGKTTLLRALAQRLTAEGRYAALAMTVEVLQRVTDPVQANAELGTRLAREAELLPEALRPPADAGAGEAGLQSFGGLLSRWAGRCPRPIALFVDEIDCLADDVLLNVLRQLRAGYTSRPGAFPHSVALVGLRDVRDFQVRLRADAESLGTASPFNVKSDSLTLRGFTAEEVRRLLAQHTEATGQAFAEAAADLVWEMTRGQPWLVNAIARQLVRKEVPDRARGIEAEDVRRAVEALILRRDTHLDSLVDKLREARVRRVVEPILVGELLGSDVLNDDLMYVRDLGLIRIEPDVAIANPIYREVIPRALTFVLQRTIPVEPAAYVGDDGGLDMDGVLRDFQGFFRRHSEAWLGRYDYREAGPHLVLMAYLQRVVNGGGRIDREFAVGSGRADLVVHWRGRRYVLELKLRYGDDTEAQGVAQLGRYLERVGEPRGWLIVFDRREAVSWDDKIYERAVAAEGREIRIFGA